MRGRARTARRLTIASLLALALLAAGVVGGWGQPGAPLAAVGYPPVQGPQNPGGGVPARLPGGATDPTPGAGRTAAWGGRVQAGGGGAAGPADVAAAGGGEDQAALRGVQLRLVAGRVAAGARGCGRRRAARHRLGAGAAAGHDQVRDRGRGTPAAGLAEPAAGGGGRR